MSDRRVAALLSDDLSGDSPPTEFRVFRAGQNDTLEGAYYFTEKSAQSVINARADWGAECMVDLEHLSTDKQSPNYDPDARGWFDLELRGGELWAVNVRWTEDGAERLRKKTQKYISPAFYFSESGEIEELFNVALVAMPKTKQATALASAEFKGKKMDIKALASVADALGVTTVEELMSALSGLMGMGGKPAEAPKPEEKKPEPAPEEPKSMSADPATEDKALAQNSALFNENVSLKRRVAELGAQIAKAESVERRALVGELVKLGAEIPATAWEDSSATSPVKRLADEPLASLKDRVAKLSAVPRGSNGSTIPATDSSGLTPDEIRICKETGCPPEKFAALKGRTK